MSGAISVERHEDATGASVALRIWCAPPCRARERDDVRPGRSCCSPSRVRSVGSRGDDRPFIVRVVGVKWPLLVTRSTSYMLAPISSASVCAPTRRP